MNREKEITNNLPTFLKTVTDMNLMVYQLEVSSYGSKFGIHSKHQASKINFTIMLLFALPCLE
jgi:hypothetical protein